MKIYLYLEDYAALDRLPRNGMEKAVAGLARGLAGAGAEVAILCEGAADRVLPPTAALPCAVHCFHDKARRGQYFLAGSLKKFIAEEIQPTDLVVLNGIFHPSVYLVSRLLRRRGIRFIVSPHDPYHDTIFIKNRKLKLPYWYLIERRLLQQALAVQVLDRRHEDLLRNRGITTPVIEVVDGFDENDVPDGSTLSWSTTGRPRLLFLGRMEMLNKGLDLLIDAMALPGPHVDAELTLQGPDYGDRAALRKRATQLNLDIRVTFLEPDYTASSSQIAARHDIMVLPSRFEGFSLAALEAMLAGRPIVISRIAGLAPHVQAANAGVLVDATIPSIALGIDQLLARRNEWREIGLRGRQYVLENLTWQKIGQGALDNYRRLLVSK